MPVGFFSLQRLWHEAQGHRAEPDDSQAHGRADAHRPQRLQGGGRRRGGQGPAVALGHVHHDGLHLEVRADDPTHVENLVAVPNIVEVSWRKSLWQMAGEDEASEEGKDGVLVVDQDGSLRAALRRAQVEPVEERDAVEEVGVHEGQRAGSLAEPGPLRLQKPKLYMLRAA